jgi:hypothetical protein
MGDYLSMESISLEILEVSLYYWYPVMDRLRR